MALTIYVDGGGGADPKYGFYVNETGKSSFIKCNQITNNPIPEYMALKSALDWLVSESAQDQEITIYGDFKPMIRQVNQEYAINNDEIRDIVRAMWPVIKTFMSLKIKWIPRKENLAGKMLGS